jgi:hypothetical protein
MNQPEQTQECRAVKCIAVRGAAAYLRGAVCVGETGDWGGNAVGRGGSSARGAAERRAAVWGVGATLGLAVAERGYFLGDEGGRVGADPSAWGWQGWVRRYSIGSGGRWVMRSEPIGNRRSQLGGCDAGRWVAWAILPVLSACFAGRIARATPECTLGLRSTTDWLRLSRKSLGSPVCRLWGVADSGASTASACLGVAGREGPEGRRSRRKRRRKMAALRGLGLRARWGVEARVRAVGALRVSAWVWPRSSMTWGVGRYRERRGGK